MQRQKMKYSNEPKDQNEFQEKFNNFYSWFAPIYCFLIKIFPLWNKWTEKALLYTSGKKVLEVSFGTGHLLSQYADKYEVFGIDLNEKMLSITQRKLTKKGLKANLQLGNVESLPYANDCFDTVINTMAFSGYPDGHKALSEMLRVLKPQGQLIIIDINYPSNHNFLGSILTEFWKFSGDIIRDMKRLFSSFNIKYSDREIGGFGSVHLYLCKK